jgi:hypothetical protein
MYPSRMGFHRLWSVLVVAGRWVSGGQDGEGSHIYKVGIPNCVKLLLCSFLSKRWDLKNINPSIKQHKHQSTVLMMNGWLCITRHGMLETRDGLIVFFVLSVDYMCSLSNCHCRIAYHADFRQDPYWQDYHFGGREVQSLQNNHTSMSCYRHTYGHLLVFDATLKEHVINMIPLHSLAPTPLIMSSKRSKTRKVKYPTTERHGRG